MAENVALSDLTLTIAGIGFGFLALGCGLLGWAYSVYTAPHPSPLFAIILAVAGLSFIVAGVGSLRILANQLITRRDDSTQIGDHARLIAIGPQTRAVLSVLAITGAAVAMMVALIWALAMIELRLPSLNGRTMRVVGERLRATSPHSVRVLIIRDDTRTPTSRGRPRANRL